MDLHIFTSSCVLNMNGHHRNRLDVASTRMKLLRWKRSDRPHRGLASPSGNERARARALTGMTALLEQAAPSSTTVYDTRIYFDGGSRGNPGVAGCGSIIVSRRSDFDNWAIRWWDWHYLGDTETNNMAEHTGLARALEAITTSMATEQHDIMIIEDSQLVLAQLTGEAVCSNVALQRILTRSQTALQQLHQYRTRHTLRQGNQLADWLANEAMNRRTTCTSTNEWTATDEYLHSRLHKVDEPDFTEPSTASRLIIDIDAHLDQQLTLVTGNHRKRKR